MALEGVLVNTKANKIVKMKTQQSITGWRNGTTTCVPFGATMNRLKKVQTTRQDMRWKANVVSSEAEVEVVSEVSFGILTEFSEDFY